MGLSVKDRGVLGVEGGLEGEQGGLDTPSVDLALPRGTTATLSV